LESEEIVRDLATVKAEVKNLKAWQAAQNGSIKETRQDVNRLKYILMGATGMVALNLLGIVFMLVKG